MHDSLFLLIALQFYRHGYNSFNVPMCGHCPIYSVLCFLVLLFSGASWIIFKRNILKFLICVVLCGVLFFQGAGQMRYFYFFMRGLAFHSESQKKSILLREAADFAMSGLSKINGYCSGRLLTDLDPDQRLEPYILKYSFYPYIDLISNKSDPDCLVVYRKATNVDTGAGFKKIFENNDGFLAKREK